MARVPGNFNAHQKNGWFGKGRQYSNYEEDENISDTGYGLVDRGGKKKSEFVNEEELKETQIAWQQREATERQERELQVQKDREKAAQAKKQQDARAAVQGKIDKLQKQIDDPGISDVQREKLQRQIWSLKNKLKGM